MADLAKGRKPDTRVAYAFTVGYHKGVVQIQIGDGQVFAMHPDVAVGIANQIVSAAELACGHYIKTKRGKK